MMKKLVPWAMIGVFVLVVVGIVMQSDEVSGNVPIWTAELDSTVVETVFSGDGTTIAAGTEDGTVYVFETDGGGEPTRTYSTGNEITALAISDNGKYLLVGSGTNIISYHTGKDSTEWLFNGNQNLIMGMAMTSNGKYTVISTYDQSETDKGKMFLFDKDSSNPKVRYEPGGVDGIIGFISGDGTRVTAGEYHAADGMNHSAILTLFAFNRIALSEKWTYDSGMELIMGGIIKDGSGIIGFGYNQTEDTWPTLFFEEEDEIPDWSRDDTNFDTIDMSEDGNSMVALDEDSILHFIDGSSGDSDWTTDLTEDGSTGWGIAISGDGTRICAGLEDGMLMVFDIDEGGEPLWEYDAGSEAEIMAIAFPTSEPFLAAGIDDTVSLFPREEALVEILDESVPDSIVFGQENIFQARDHAKITRYQWESDRKGILYDGPSNSFPSKNLSLGAHTITLIVKNLKGDWSEPDTAYINITAPDTLPSEYSDAENPTVFFHGPNRFIRPPPDYSIHDGTIVWSNDLLGDTDVYMFDISEPDEVRLISSPSYFADLNDALTDYVNQETPRVFDGTIVWRYSFSGADIVRTYDPELSLQGGELVFEDARLSENSFDFSEKWVIWTQNKPIPGSSLSGYDLFIYKIGTGEITKMENLPSDNVAVDGNHLLYVTGQEGDGISSSGKTTINIRNLDNETDIFNYTIKRNPSNFHDMDFWGENIVWADERHNKNSDLEDPNTDIYYLNWREMDMRRITTDTSPQLDPRVSDSFIVWVDERSGDSAIHAYSITENTTAILRSNGTTNYNPIVDNNYAAWQYLEPIPDTFDEETYYYLFRMGQAEWTTGEAIIFDLDGGNDPVVVEDPESSGDMPPYHSIENLYFLASIGMIGLGLVVILFSFGKAKKVNKNIAKGLVLLILGAAIGAAVIPITMKTGEDYDAWVKEEQEAGETIQVAVYIDSVEEFDMGGESLYTYYFKGSDVPVMSAANIGGEGDFVVTTIEIDEIGIPVVATTNRAPIYIAPAFILILIGMVIALKGAKREKFVIGGPSSGSSFGKTTKEMKKEEKRKEKELKKAEKLSKKGLDHGKGKFTSGLSDLVPKNPAPDQNIPSSGSTEPSSPSHQGPMTGPPYQQQGTSSSPSAPPLPPPPPGQLPGGQPPGMRPPGIQPAGSQPYGMQSQGVQPTGHQSPGMQSQGMQPTAHQSPGMQPPGMQPPGVGSPGMQPPGGQPRGMGPPVVMGAPGSPPQGPPQGPKYPGEHQPVGHQIPGGQPIRQPPNFPPTSGVQPGPPSYQPQSPGLQAPKPYQSAPSGPWTCPNCGQSIEGSFAFCTSCGHHK